MLVVISVFSFHVCIFCSLLTYFLMINSIIFTFNNIYSKLLFMNIYMKHTRIWTNYHIYQYQWLFSLYFYILRVFRPYYSSLFFFKCLGNCCFSSSFLWKSLLSNIFILWLQVSSAFWYFKMKRQNEIK